METELITTIDSEIKTPISSSKESPKFQNKESEKDWENPLVKIEQLLTCPICLDRYKFVNFYF